MKKSKPEMLDVIIVGAGQGGLSVSYFLHKENVDHLILERGKIGESWRSQRWDSFALNTPNFINALPGAAYEGEHTDGFMHRDQFVEYLENYRKKFQLPVKEHSRVTSVNRLDEDVFEVNAEHGNRTHRWLCRQLVLASGAMSAPRVPSYSHSLPDDIFQLHASTYKNPGQLPEGATLVVGCGQSGCQITEDLLASGRKVYLATSKVGRIPRRYRGKDTVEWMVQMNFLDMPVDAIQDPAVLKAIQPQVSGIGRYGHTVSLQDLHRQGATILGHLDDIKGYEIILQDNAAEHVRFADEFSAQIKQAIDNFIRDNGIKCGDQEEDAADRPDVTASCADPATTLHLKEKNITSVIWTTGFRCDMDFVNPSVTNEDGMPMHDKGIASVDGVYFIGFPWMRSRKSGLVYGMNEDASHIARHIIGKEVDS